MRFLSTLILHQAFRSATNLGVALLLSFAVAILSACDSHSAEESLTYRVTDGACGDVVFVERIGIDSTSAFKTIEARKIDQYGRDDVRIEAYPLEVVDMDGNVPDPEFYGLRVLDVDTRTLLHSVSEVITSEGDLFNLMWCPD